MSIFKTTGYKDIECLLSIAAINPPDSRSRALADNKGEEDVAFHLTVVNGKDTDNERSAYIPLSKKQLRNLNKLIDSYLKTGITKEL